MTTEGRDIQKVKNDEMVEVGISTIYFFFF